MRQIVPWLIVCASFLFFFVLLRRKRSEEANPGLFKRIWRKIVAVWDFLTNFG